MDPFDPPGDPGDPRDKRTKPETKEKHYVVNTATSENKIQPELAEHQRNANGNKNKYKKEADEAKAVAHLAQRQSNNTSFIERLLKNHAE